MKQKGFTLLEVVLVMLIMSIGMVCVYPHVNLVEEIRFKALAKEVERGVKNAQYMAIVTGREYNVYCTERSVYVRCGYQKVYRIDMSKQVKIPSNITGKLISFKGTMAPSKGGTIELVDALLIKKARITVRIATGKTTIYFDRLS